MDVCLITGTSTGIGRAAALHLARSGFRVRATMRNLDKAGPLMEAASREKLPLAVSRLDVADGAAIQPAVEQIVAEEGRIDALVNNAGLSSSSPVEIYPEDEHRALFEANYFGPVRLTQAVLPGMRERGRGAIVNVSSILGRIAWANQAAYCASKFAIEAFSEALAQEVAPLGLRVAIVEPGVVASAIFENTPVHYDRNSPYKAAMRRNGRFYRTGVPQATAPEEIAEVIREAITTDRPRLRWAHGWGAGAVARRAAMRDEDFVALGALEDEAYYERLRDELGVDLA
jgi:NAD(P)-dependent dehydrogenase (short-subunit alcohol dehydrogenase family)